jgi:hypothetical protein
MKQILKLFLLIFFTTQLVTAQTTSNPTISAEFCKAFNSLDIYTKNNLATTQQFLKNSYFPKIIISGENDSQFKYYIGKYQYAFGLRVTGQINEETLKLFKTQNNCFDLERKFLEMESSVPVFFKSQAEILLDILNLYFYQANGL